MKGKKLTSMDRLSMSAKKGAKSNDGYPAKVRKKGMPNYPCESVSSHKAKPNVKGWGEGAKYGR
tara:strand:- start:8333 stop:8524 length:192 start_codon:yes stop_codon:yes gene_type:complete